MPAQTSSLRSCRTLRTRYVCANILHSVVFGMSEPDAVLSYKRGLSE